MIMSVFVLYKNINGADLGEIYVTRSACTEFLSNKSEVMKDEMLIPSLEQKRAL